MLYYRDFKAKFAEAEAEAQETFKRGPGQPKIGVNRLELTPGEALKKKKTHHKKNSSNLPLQEVPEIDEEEEDETSMRDEVIRKSHSQSD